jgi:hypothetical protein
MRRAALLTMLVLAGCGRPAFDNSREEAAFNRPMPAGLEVVVFGGEGDSTMKITPADGSAPVLAMDKAVMVSDPGSGGPDRTVEVKMSDGDRAGDTLKFKRRQIAPKDVGAWLESSDD